MNADIVTLFLVALVSSLATAIGVGLYCWRAGRIFERWKLARHLSEVITQAVDKAIGPGGEDWAAPMRKEIQKRMFEQIKESGKATRH